MILVYWLGVLIVVFSIISIIVIDKADDEQLHADRDTCIQGMLILSIFGAILIIASNCSLNFQKEREMEKKKCLQSLHKILNGEK